MEQEDYGYESAFASPDYFQEQEAHFFWTISDFEQLIRDNGAYLVVRHLSDVVKEQLYKEIRDEGM